MTPKYYSSERNIQILISLLKHYNIKKVIASPGATNVSFVASIQQDDFFEIYSCVDERSAAYMACGMAEETGEPIIINCTGATSSRNYMPGLTEAYYRKLPIIAITSTQNILRVGHLIAQVTDRSKKPSDIVIKDTYINIINTANEERDCVLKLNDILQHSIEHSGPVHINIATTYSQDFSVKDLPNCDIITRITHLNNTPTLNNGKIAIFIGSHKPFNTNEETAIDNFCARYNAVAFCDHTSGYKGKYRVLYSLVAGQRPISNNLMVDTLIHIGEVSGDYYTLRIQPKEVWRINPDGEMRDTFRKLKYVFEMNEIDFFNHYSSSATAENKSYFNSCQDELKEISTNIPELPFSNVWIAQQTAHRIPQNSVLHLGILNTLRSWNFFDVDKNVRTNCNVGGFGIDGILSTLIGASLTNPHKLYFGVIGDLAFFYDMNALGNHNVGNNVRIMLINNGRGTEFRNYDHPGNAFGDNADAYIAAAGHFGNKSVQLIRHYAEDLGYKYLTANNKTSYLENLDEFLAPSIGDKPIIFEVFTDSTDESDALKAIRSIKIEEISTSQKIKSGIRNIIGDKAVKAIKKIIR
ncbi:MAG: 2-succinyl-5-enolpyruvyl-6-hydroxy-3-cyclohexene-1-carboxylate synthase [Muribaculaceae bacterium]|nr:2-succinyl-5-enolpyruvyl-6-hydroxy-3-cyclohexene-1-carboxylate synthase [Muribaculaceae bacterium]